MEAGDLAAIQAVLKGASSDLFIRIREQKLLFRAPLDHRDAIADLLRSGAARLAPDGRGDFDNYIEFALAIDAARTRCLERVHSALKGMPRCSISDLLAAGEEVFDWCMNKQFKEVDLYSVGASVAERERRLHDLNGAANDIAMAVARIVNDCSRIMPTQAEVRLTRAQRKLAVQTLRRALPAAGNVNSLEWFFDSVTYGEFKVDKVAHGAQPTYRLHFVEAKRYLLKSLAIRRSLVQTLMGRRQPRFVREQLKELESPMFDSAIAYYLDVAGSSGFADIDLSRAHATTAAMLATLDAEDDLLVAASGSDFRALAYYVVAMALRWYGAAAVSLRDVPQVVDRRSLAAAPIPLKDVAAAIKGLDPLALSEAVDCLTLELPARSHTHLIDRPFVRDGADLARPFLRSSVGTWTAVVRAALIQGGALGKSVGAVWEDFLAKSFDGSDWQLVGQGVKLRKDGQTLTDVDLLLVREDLLLVMQIKGLIGMGNGPYDHWRNRQTIQFGCTQARIAAKFLKEEPQSLASICGKRVADSIRQVQPVVLTNIDQLDGWRFEDVPVIGEVTRKAICRGARVDYQDQNGDVIHTHHIVKPEDLTTATILQLLEQPIEMYVAAEGTETTHRAHSIGGLTLLMPEFVIRDDANDPPSHEPNPSAWVAGG